MNTQTTNNRTRCEAKEAWDQAVEAKVASGVNLTRAKSAVVKEQPEIREQLLAAFNPTVPQTTKPPALVAERLRVAAEAEIERLATLNGGNRQRAARQLFTEMPELREKLVAAANGK